jgi:hypothetical protein
MRCFPRRCLTFCRTGIASRGRKNVAVAPNATILYQLRVPALSAFSLVGFQVAVEPPQ